MGYKLLYAGIAVFICALIFSCGETGPVSDDPGPDDILQEDTLGMPTNVHIDYLKIVYTDTLDSSGNIIDSFTLGSFIVTWDSVPGATKYCVLLYDGNEDFDTNFYVDTCLKLIDSLEPNETYKVIIMAYAIIPTSDTTYDTIIGKKTDFTAAELYQPLPPENIKIDFTGLTARVSWEPYIDEGVLGYTVYLRSYNDSIIYSTTVDSFTSSTNFIVDADTVYKINIRTLGKIGLGILCSAFVYDVTTTQDNSFRLPYVYVSTYSKPTPLIIDSIAGEMVGVKGGIFAMGNIWEDSTYISREQGKPLHEVVISPFYLGKSEITNAQYVLFLNEQDVDSVSFSTVYKDSIIIDTLGNPIDTIAIPVDTIFTFSVNGDTLMDPNNETWHISYVYDSILSDTVFVVDSGFEKYPVASLCWVGATDFCNWLSEKTGNEKCYNDNGECDFTKNGYRLPTEAEFEYVQSTAFLGTKQRYPWGYTHEESKYSSDTTGPCEVGCYIDYYGFFDLTGNIMELCNDWSDNLTSEDSSYYATCLQAGVVFNPKGPGPNAGTGHVLRGGSYAVSGEENISTWRHLDPGFSVIDYGFRVAKNAN